MSSQHTATRPVRVGDHAPDFSLPAHPGGEFSLHSAGGAYNVVLYFYPEDDTPGCAKQACGYRELARELEKIGTRIYGVSRDDLASHQRFAAKYQLPFPLLYDEGGRLRARFGNPDGSAELIGRITYIIDKHGLVRHIINADRTAIVEDHLEQSWEWARKLAAE